MKMEIPPKHCYPPTAKEDILTQKRKMRGIFFLL
jgi:hypothetical protein